jgi:hypothetical protein
MKKIEDKIWDSITASAKDKFDFASFEEDIPQFADMALFKIIVDFAVNKPLNVIAGELHNQVLMTGFVWKMDDITEFLEGKREILKHEINIAQLAADMLQNGNSPQDVYKTLTGLL